MKMKKLTSLCGCLLLSMCMGVGATTAPLSAEAAARAGAWVLGWVSYEAAPAWDSALPVRAVDGPALPLAWFAVYPQGPQPWPAQQLAKRSVQ